MAKEDMLCPFTGKLCGECPLYRGRHYYLCFSKKYRGHLEEPGKKAGGGNPVIPGVQSAKQPQALGILPSAIDPFKRPLADIWD